MSENQAVSEPVELDELRYILLKPDVLIDKITPVIIDILKEQIAESSDEMAEAISPIIGEALRRQVYEAREDIIDALYPVIGETISRAIAEAIQELARTVDSRVRVSIRPQDTVRRWLARLRGISEAEYRFRESLPFSVREIFLIQRESGLLIHHETGDPERGNDRDLVSGMLTAIRDFAREAFGRGEIGELGAIEYEDQHILLQAGGAAYLAVVIDGVEPNGFREKIRQTLIPIHEQHYDSLKQFDGSDQELIKTTEKVLGAAFSAPASTPEEKNLSLFQRILLVGLGLLLILPPLLICGWWIWRVENGLAALGLPSPTLTVTFTPTATSTNTPLPTSTQTHTPTFTPIPTATPTTLPTLTLTPTPRPTNTNTPAPTATPTALPTFTLTSTPLPTSTPSDTPVASRFDGVVISNIFVRDNPADDAINFDLVVPSGTPVEFLAQYGDWYKVRAVLPEQPDIEITGWVQSVWVTLSDPIPPSLITPTLTP